MERLAGDPEYGHRRRLTVPSSRFAGPTSDRWVSLAELPGDSVAFEEAEPYERLEDLRWQAVRITFSNGGV